MKTVILCGGQGTRIRDVSGDIPKAMIPIGPHPILWHIMKHYAGQGHDDFILCLGYQGDLIRRYFLDYAMMRSDVTLKLGGGAAKIHRGHAEDDWTVTLADTGEATMTGGRVRRIRPHLVGDETFFLTYGDGLGDVDLSALLAFHRSHGKALTVTGVHPPGRFGEIEVGEGGTITGFAEKPANLSARVSGGFFVAEPRLFDYLEGDDDLVLEQAPMERLVEASQVRMYPHDGFWQCMDTYQDYTVLNGLWEHGAPWRTW